MSTIIDSETWPTAVYTAYAVARTDVVDRMVLDLAATEGGVRGDFDFAAARRIRDNLRAAHSASSWVKIFLEKDARAIGLTDLVKRRLDEGSLRLLGKGFVEQIAGGHNALLATVDTVVASLGDETSQALVAQWLEFETDATSGFESLKAELEESGASIVLDAATALAGKALDTSDFLSLSNTIENALNAEVTDTLTRARAYLGNVASDLSEININLRDVSEVQEGFARSADRLSSLAAAGAAVLSLTGNSDAAKDLQRGMRYVEAGMKFQQCVATLAMAGSGWGAAVSLLGLADGLGGLGVNGNGSDGHRDLMNAIANLMEEVRAQFKVVNAKLDALADDLANLAKALGQVQKTVLDTYSVVKRIESKIDYLSVSLDLA